MVSSSPDCKVLLQQSEDLNSQCLLLIAFGNTTLTLKDGEQTCRR